MWKKKWGILRDMPPYPFPKQVQIVLATMALHNFIRRHPTRGDADFQRAEEADERLPAGDVAPSQTQENEDGVICTKEGEGANEMAALRDQITTMLVGD